MPAPGDQHKLNGATTANPFEDQKPHISEYTAQEIATLQSRLNKRLGPEFLSTRPGPGNQKIPYLSAEKAINLANEVFGFNGWSTSIQNIQIDFVDEHAQSGKVSIGLSVVVRVTLKDGTYHEDIGYGSIENCKGKAMAFEKSKKEATTDALKRALRSFGNVLGNCVYDRDYVTKVSKIKAGNSRFDINELHRHPDFVPKISEDIKPPVTNGPPTNAPPSLVPEESFDTSEFDDFDFTDNDLSHSEEILLPPEVGPNIVPQNSRANSMNMHTPSKAPQPRQQAQQDVTNSRLPGQQPSNVNGSGSVEVSRTDQSTHHTPQASNNPGEKPDQPHLSSPGVPSEHFPVQEGQGGVQMAPPVTAGFYSARVTQKLDPSTLSANPPKSYQFVPNLEARSLRKTAGFDHTKSTPVRRELQPSTVPNVIDPRSDQNRRIGMPGAPLPSPVSRPGMSTSAYRPPTRHGSPAVPGTAVLPNGPDRNLTAAKRPPLNDVSNTPHHTTAVTVDGADAKRQKLNSGGTKPGGVENAHNVSGSDAT